MHFAPSSHPTCVLKLKVSTFVSLANNSKLDTGTHTHTGSETRLLSLLEVHTVRTIQNLSGGQHWRIVDNGQYDLMTTVTLLLLLMMMMTMMMMMTAMTMVTDKVAARASELACVVRRQAWPVLASKPSLRLTRAAATTRLDWTELKWSGVEWNGEHWSGLEWSWLRRGISESELCLSVCVWSS